MSPSPHLKNGNDDSVAVRKSNEVIEVKPLKKSTPKREGKEKLEDEEGEKYTLKRGKNHTCATTEPEDGPFNGSLLKSSFFPKECWLHVFTLWLSSFQNRNFLGTTKW